MSLFAGRTVVVATKHRKEQVIAPLLKNRLGVVCLVPENLDTDLLGTFTGEVERHGNPVEVARTKCIMAMELTGSDIAIASEGSFGPHPQVPFIPADEEVLLFIDKNSGLEISVREISTETNYAYETVTTIDDLLAFANNVAFPSHGLILRKSKEDNLIFKGITNKEDLLNKFSQLKADSESILVETDMRAMYNPTRMKVIEHATEKLISKILSVCPQCATPGFDVVDVIRGLACAECNLPTQSIKELVYRCTHCNYQETKPNPHKKKEDPAHCDYCNP